MKKPKKYLTEDAAQSDGYRRIAEGHLKKAARYIRDARNWILTGRIRRAQFEVIAAIHASARALDALIWAESWRPKK